LSVFKNDFEESLSCSPRLDLFVNNNTVKTVIL